MNSFHIKKGDMVVVLSGAHKGKVGKVLAAMPNKGRALVEGVNIVKKSMRKSQDNPKGGIITKEAPLQVSKLMLQARFDARAKKHGRAVSSAS